MTKKEKAEQLTTIERKNKVPRGRRIQTAGLLTAELRSKKPYDSCLRYSFTQVSLSCFHSFTELSFQSEGPAAKNKTHTFHMVTSPLSLSLSLCMCVSLCVRACVCVTHNVFQQFKRRILNILKT